MGKFRRASVDSFPASSASVAAVNPKMAESDAAQPALKITITVRIIKSFEYRTAKNLVLHGAAHATPDAPDATFTLETTVAELKQICKKAVVTQPGWKPYQNVALDTMKLYFFAHGQKVPVARQDGTVVRSLTFIRGRPPILLSILTRTICLWTIPRLLGRLAWETRLKSPSSTAKRTRPTRLTQIQNGDGRKRNSTFSWDPLIRAGRLLCYHSSTLDVINGPHRLLALI